MGSKDIVREFTVCGNRVTVHMPAHCADEARPDADEGRSGETSPALPDSLPAVYLHVHDGDGSEVLQLCRELGYREFVLAAIRPRCWNDDLTPWGCPGLFADDAPFAGKAAEQLRLLESQIIPRVEGGAPRKPEQRVLAGYSLAGLFATWATFNSAAFGRVASASGSLWYPDFTGYAAANKFARACLRIFLAWQQGGAHAQPAFAQRGARHARCRRPVRGQRRAHRLRAKSRQPLQGTRPTYGKGHRLGAGQIA